MKRLSLIGVGITLVLALASLLVLVRLGAAPFWDYDEASYAQITHMMLTQHSVISQEYFHGPFLEKPPLYEWLAALSALAFGENEFAFRLPSALAGIALIGFTMLLAYALTRNSLAAFFSGAVLLTTSPVIETARQMRIDVLVTLWIVLGAWAVVRAVQDKRYFLLFGVALALAIMTKSVVAFFALAALPLLLGWLGELRLLRSREVWGGVGVAFLLALPWHLIEFMRFGQRFWQDYVVFNITSRVRTDLFQLAPTTNRDYLWYLNNFALPWTQVFVLLFAPLVLWWRHIPRRIRAAIGFGISMVALVSTVFFVSATKAPTYLVPLYPFAALALGSAFAFLIEKARGPARILCATIGTVLLVVGFCVTIYNGFHLNTAYYGKADALAREEREIATVIATRPESRWLVFGDDRELGAIMYYAKRYDPAVLTSTTTLAVGDMVLMYQTKRPLFFAHYPFSTVALMEGEQLILLEVVSED
jgi:4-amino-4-deoxy-L-arabinose transferase-like glycosyltransferase